MKLKLRLKKIIYIYKIDEVMVFIVLFIGNLNSKIVLF